MASSASLETQSTSGFGSEDLTSSMNSTINSNIFNQSTISSSETPVQSNKKSLTIGQKRAQEAREARQAAAAAAKPTTTEQSTNKPKKATSRKKRSNANTSTQNNNIQSTEANIGLNKPHLRKVQRNVNTSTNTGSTISALFESNTNSTNETRTIPESNRMEMDAELEDIGDTDIPSEPETPEIANRVVNVITPMADPSMFLLLRIGNDSASEYIELRKQPMASMGSFNTHTLGSTKEIQNLYGIKSSEAYKAMQRAFGVPRYGKKAPFEVYLYEKQCKFQGFDLVKEALQTRIRTLNESLRLSNSGSMNAKRNQHFLDWLKQQVEAMGSIRKVCPIEPVPTVSQISPGGPLKPQDGCPCLEDLSLLRDLVFLVATIQGIATPAVQKQLESIPLKKLLNVAVKPAEKRTILQQALNALEKLSVLETKNTGIGTNTGLTVNVGIGTNTGLNTVSKEQIQEILKTIWKALTNEDRTTTVTKEEILERIESILASVRNYETSKQKVDTLTAELDDSRLRLAALRQILQKVDEDTDTLEDPYDEIEYLADQLQKAADKSVEDSGIINTLTSQLAEATRKLAESQTEKTTEKGKLEAEKQGLQTELNELKNQLETRTQTIQSLEIQLSASEAKFKALEEGDYINTLSKLKAAKEAIALYKYQLENCNKKVVELMDAVTEKGAKGDKLNTLVEELTTENTKLTDELNTLRETLQTTTTDLERTKKNAEKQKQDSIGNRAYIEELETQKDVITEKVSSLKTQIRGLEATIVALEESHRKALETFTNEKITIMSTLGEEQGKASGLDARLRELEVALAEAQEKAVRVNTAEAAQRETAIKLAEKTAELEASKTAAAFAAKSAADKEKELTTKLAGAQHNLQTLETQMEDTKATSDAEQAEQEEALKQAQAQVAALKSELEGTQSTGSEAQKSFEEAKQSLEGEIYRLQQEVATAQEELQEKSALERELEATKQAKESAEARISAIQAQVTNLETKLSAEQRNSTSKLVAKNTEATQKEVSYKAELDTLQKALAAAEETKTKAEAEAAEVEARFTKEQAQKNVIIAEKNSQLRTVMSNRDKKQEQIEEMERQIQELQTLKTTSSQKNQTIEAQSSEIESLEKSLKAAQEASEESMAALEKERDEKKALEETLQTTIQSTKPILNTEQEKKVRELQEEVAKLTHILEDNKEDTKKRLDTLLSMIVINEDMKDKVMKVWEGKGDAKNLKLLSDDIQTDMCEFYTYLVSLTNMQWQKIKGTIPSSLRNDIFQIFEKLPEDMPKDTEILKDITVLFQELFVKSGKTDVVEARILSGSYPALYKVLANYSVKDGNPTKFTFATAIQYELGSFQFLSDTGLVPIPDKEGAFEIQRKEKNVLGVGFLTQNYNHYTPFIIIGIKFVQLLNKLLNDKYRLLKERCGSFLSPS